MWDEEDGFFYDVLRFPDGTGRRIEVRSLVGPLPLCAATVIEPEVIERFSVLPPAVLEYLRRNSDLLSNIAEPLRPGVEGRYILSLLNEEKLRRILNRMLDVERFLGPSPGPSGRWLIPTTGEEPRMSAPIRGDGPTRSPAGSIRRRGSTDGAGRPVG
jgi:hypothetical protein